MSSLSESTLTSPSDRDRSKRFELSKEQSLDDSQTRLAMGKLNIKSFPEVERRYTDPPVDLQKIGLFSFVPARGATPNPQGVYGFAKLRGNFASEVEADERAENLVRTVDSYHQIYHTYVGRPFPLTTSSEFSKEVARIDMKKELSSAYSDDVKKKRDKEQKEVEEIKQREQELLDDVKKNQEDDSNRHDYYTTLRVKKAQLLWTYIETEKKLNQMCSLIAKARREIEELDEKDPELNKCYYQRYVDSRKQAGLPVDRESTDQSFMRFLVEDVSIPSIEAEYRKLYGDE